MTDTGRRSLVIVRPIHVTTRPDWPTGPLPLRVGELVTTTQTRSTYFSTPCNRILYGTPDRPTRWHLTPEELDPALDCVLGVEVLVPDLDTAPRTGLAVLHLADTDDQQLDLLRAAAGRPGAAAPSAGLTAPSAGLTEMLSPFAVEVPDARACTVAFKSSTDPLVLPVGISERLGWSPAQAWLWQLASRSTAQDYPPDPDYPERPFKGTVVLSADWRALVTRDGAAFVALRPDLGPDDPFLHFAHLYTHTTYLDALLLGMIQRSSVEQMVSESAAAFDAPDLPRHLEHLEQRAARFRTIYWLRDASTHGHANNILDAYHAQHELPQRFDAVLSEIADLGRIVQNRDAQRIGAALGVLTVVGLPFGAALETLQALNATSVQDLAIALGIALVVSSGLLTTRVGRLLIRQIRQLR